MKSLPGPYLSRQPYNAGSILVICIWVLVFFSVLSAGLYGMVSTQIRLTRSLADRGMSLCAARAACVYARLKLQKDQTLHDTLYELSSEEEGELGRAKFIYTLSDEESRININTASEDVISGLSGLNPELALNIVDSSLRPFSLKEELLLVEGISEEIFNECSDFITVHSNGKVNINTASGPALSALGLTADLITIIEDFRKGADNKQGTEDDGVFESTGEVTTKLELTAEQQALLSSLISRGLFSIESENFLLAINTQVLDRPAMQYSVIIDKDKIKEWKEY